MPEIPQSPQKQKNNYLSWLLWWQLDPDELQKQVNNYKTLKIYQSSRGISFLLLLLSSGITVLFITFFDIGINALVDICLFLILGTLMLRGYRWAMIASIGLWTYEKLFQIIDGFSTGINGSLFMAVIWWSTYLHYFYTAFKVEGLRKKQAHTQGGIISDVAASTVNPEVPLPPAPPAPTADTTPVAPPPPAPSPLNLQRFDKKFDTTGPIIFKNK